MNVNEFFAEAMAAQRAAQHRTNEEQMRLRRNQDRYDAAIHALTPKMAELHKALVEVGLVPDTMRVLKTGSGADWKEGDMLRLDITAVPTVYRPFRFRTFRGYDARGNDKDSAALYDKAAKLKAHLEQATGLTVQVNHYSMQVRDGSEQGRVLIEIFVK